MDDNMVMVCKEINMFLSFLAGIDRETLLYNMKKNKNKKRISILDDCAM